MGRKQHPGGKAGTWIEVKVIKGRPYWYERTRVTWARASHASGANTSGPGRSEHRRAQRPNRTNGRKPTVRTNPHLIMVKPTTRSPHRAPPLAAGK